MQTFPADESKFIKYYTTDTNTKISKREDYNDAWISANKEGVVLSKIKTIKKVCPVKFSWAYFQQLDCLPLYGKGIKNIILKELRKDYPKEECCIDVRTDWIKRPVHEVLCSRQFKTKSCIGEILILRATLYTKCMLNTLKELQAIAKDKRAKIPKNKKEKVLKVIKAMPQIIKRRKRPKAYMDNIKKVTDLAKTLKPTKKPIKTDVQKLAEKSIPKGLPTTRDGKPILPPGILLKPDGSPQWPKGLPTDQNNRIIWVKGLKIDPSGKPIWPKGVPLDKRNQPLWPFGTQFTKEGIPIWPKGITLDLEGIPIWGRKKKKNKTSPFKEKTKELINKVLEQVNKSTSGMKFDDVTLDKFKKIIARNKKLFKNLQKLNVSYPIPIIEKIGKIPARDVVKKLIKVRRGQNFEIQMKPKAPHNPCVNSKLKPKNKEKIIKKIQKRVPLILKSDKPPSRLKIEDDFNKIHKNCGNLESFAGFTTEKKPKKKLKKCEFGTEDDEFDEGKSYLKKLAKNKESTTSKSGKIVSKLKYDSKTNKLYDEAQRLANKKEKEIAEKKRKEKERMERRRKKKNFISHLLVSNQIKYNLKYQQAEVVQLKPLY